MTAAGLSHRCFWQETTEDRMARTAATRADHVPGNSEPGCQTALDPPASSSRFPKGAGPSSRLLKNSPPARCFVIHSAKADGGICDAGTGRSR